MRGACCWSYHRAATCRHLRPLTTYSQQSCCQLVASCCQLPPMDVLTTAVSHLSHLPGSCKARQQAISVQGASATLQSTRPLYLLPFSPALIRQLPAQGAAGVRVLVMTRLLVRRKTRSLAWPALALSELKSHRLYHCAAMHSLIIQHRIRPVHYRNTRSDKPPTVSLVIEQRLCFRCNAIRSGYETLKTPLTALPSL